MKFLVDAQLPQSISSFFKERGFDCIHTLDLPEKNKTKDTQISKIANDEGRIVISKDTDFLLSLTIKREPRKLILITTGNISNPQLLIILEKNFKMIIKTISRSRLIEITKTSIIEHK